MAEDTPELLDRLHLSFRSLRETGDMHEHDYFKALVALACRWIAIGHLEDGVRMVSELTPEYAAVGMPFQMQHDEDFRVVALAVAKNLDLYVPHMDEDDVKLATMLLDKPTAKA